MSGAAGGVAARFTRVCALARGLALAVLVGVVGVGGLGVVAVRAAAAAPAKPAASPLVPALAPTPVAPSGGQRPAAGVPEAPLLRIEAGMHTAAVLRIDTDASGRYAVTASPDKTARVWDVASGRLLQVLRPPVGEGHEGKLFAVAISPDAGTVAAAGWTGGSIGDGRVQVYLFERASGRLLRRLGGLPDVVYHLAFSPDGRWLAATLGGRHGLRLWDWRNPGAPALADADYGDQSYGAAFSRDGTLATSSWDGQLRLYRPADLPRGTQQLSPRASLRAPGGARPFALAFHPDGSRLAVAYEDSARVDVLDGRSLQPQHQADSRGIAEGELGAVAWSADGRTLAAAGTWAREGRKTVRLWADGGRGAARDVPATEAIVMHLAPLPAGGWLLAAADPAWGVLGADGRWQPRGLPPTADLRGSLGEAFRLATGGQQVQFGFGADGALAHHVDLRQRQLREGPLPAGQAPDTHSLPLSDWDGGAQPRLRGQPLPLRASERARSVAVLPSAAGFVLGSSYALRHFDAEGRLRWELPVPAEVWGVNVVADGPGAGRLLVAAYGDGTLRWHRLSDGRELLAWFGHADRRRWVLWTPGGWFDASPGAEDLIGWQLNRGAEQAGDFFPAGRFRSRYWRPDIVDRVLLTLDEAQAVAQAGPAPASPAPLPTSATAPAPPPAPALSPAFAPAPSLAQATPPPPAALPAPPAAVPAPPAPQPTPAVSGPRPPPAEPAKPPTRPAARPPAPGAPVAHAAPVAAPALPPSAAPVAAPPARPPGAIADLLPPVVDLLSDSDVRLQQAQLTVRVQARSAADAPVTGWRVRVNGVAVPAQLQALPPGADARSPRELLVPLPPRDSDVLVFAENRHGVSSAAAVRVTWVGVAAPAAAPEFQVQPRLYVLAVGVGAYQDPQIPGLGPLPAKDARDFAQAMRQQQGGLYRSVELRLITDAQATRDAVMDGLEWLQRQTTQHDVAMLFLSGHGVNDPAMGYLYLPANAQLDALKRSAVNWSEIRSTLVSMAGKRILFMDTCHAGNVMGGNLTARAAFSDISGVLSDLASSENGMVVFSSSTGRQYSLQHPSWGNGAFSKALVEGLGGQAAQGSRPYITHKMLSVYVSERVKELTRGQQTPVNPDPIGVPDFPVALRPGSP